MKFKYLLWIVILVAVAWAPTVNAGKQLVQDQRYRQRDRLAVAYANDVQFWTAYYTGVQQWIVAEGVQP